MGSVSEGIAHFNRNRGKISMRIFVLVCGALLVLAAGYALLSSGYQPATLVERVLAQPLPQKIAWFVILVAPATLIAFALWQTEKLLREREVTGSLQTRLRGVHDGISGLERSQKDADSAATYLTNTDPEDAIKSLQQRLAKTEETAQLQQSRNEALDLLSRIEDLRKQQQAFRETLAEVVGKRRSIEQAFADLQRTQSDIDRVLLDIEGDGTSLQDRVQSLAASINGANPRFDDIERSMEALIQLKRALGVLQTRLAPLEQNEHGGVKNLIKAVHDVRDQLVATVDRLDRDGEANLAERVTKLTESRQQLEGRVSSLLDEFSKLDSIHKDISGILSKLGNEIKANLV
jgi:DNA repair exonuclease SbcCD ATPase subunit